MAFIDKLSKFVSSAARLASIICDGLSISDDVVREIAKGVNPKISGPVKDIIEVLDTYNIRYDTEKTFADCKNVKCLPFDFCIYTNNRFFLIEYDGIQHYKPSFGLNEEQKMENYSRTKQNDTIKDQYCRDNNIKLYRIAYNENHIERVIAILRRHRMI